MNDIAQLARLLQLASPTLPVGTFSYSQGLESAVEAGIIQDKSSAQQWISDVLHLSVARMEAPILLRLYRAWQERDFVALGHWNEFFIASRESAELRAETLQMGYSMTKLMEDLQPNQLQDFMQLQSMQEVAYPTVYAFAVSHWKLDIHNALLAYLWSWLENQVMAAIKAVPLGQTHGQQMLLELGATLEDVVAKSNLMDDEAMGSFVPGLAILSSRHETQYSRIFRS
jgi:urease accessory protein